MAVEMLGIDEALTLLLPDEAVRQGAPDELWEAFDAGPKGEWRVREKDGTVKTIAW